MKPPRPNRREPIAGLGHYVLAADGRTPLLEENFMEWARWFETSGESRRVGRTEIGSLGYVSTVFLGLDHGWRSPRPILFETMSFLGDGDHGETYFARYATWDEAEAGHAAIVEAALRALEASSVLLADFLVPADRER